MALKAEYPIYDGFEKLRLLYEYKSRHKPTFHPFNELPPELRFDIWELAISERQIASLTEGGCSGIDDDIKHGRLPAFLFVSHECRARALKMNRYPIRFTFQHVRSVPPAHLPFNSWVEDNSDEDVPPGFPYKGVQRCAIGPDDIVAIRLEGSWYQQWGRCFTRFYDDPYIDDYHWAAPDPRVRFTGYWGGDWKKIRNWLMPTPLIPHHPDPVVNGIEAGRVEYWAKNQFQLLFHRTLYLPYPNEFRDECLYYLVYDWHNPKDDNLTGCDLEEIENCSKYLSKPVSYPAHFKGNRVPIDAVAGRVPSQIQPLHT